VNVLRVIRTALGISIIVFTVAGIGVSFAIVGRQKALQDTARDYMVRAVSQAVGEFYRFEERAAAFGGPGNDVDKDEVQRRFDILANLLGIFGSGEAKAFTDARPEQGETVAALGCLVAELAPLVRAVGQPGYAARILALSRPFEARLANLAAAANRFSGDLTSADLRRLIQLHWIFSGIAAALVLCGLGFIALLFLQNRLLTRAYRNVHALAEDLRVAKNAADTANEAKSRFLATMSHELRTPLNAVIGFSEIIASESFGPVGRPAYRDYAFDILHSGHHMLAIVNDILTLARLEAGRYEIEPVPTDLRNAVDQAVNMFRGTRQAAGRTIVLAPESGWPWIAADDRALRQMLLNLLSNAAKFSDPETPIEVRCDRSAEGEVTLAVIDRGIGMTGQETQQAVGAFYQADSRLARKYDGSGLGLSIVSGLIACHGGRLQIDSEPGVGTRVSLVFPATAACAPGLPAVA
jgi:signal transduction histidine kinase